MALLVLDIHLCCLAIRAIQLLRIKRVVANHSCQSKVPDKGRTSTSSPEQAVRALALFTQHRLHQVIHGQNAEKEPDTDMEAEAAEQRILVERPMK